MLASKLSRNAASWLLTSSRTSKLASPFKGKAKSSLQKSCTRARAPTLSTWHARGVITISDPSDEALENVPHVTDLRGLNDTVQTITGVPQSQLARKVQIFKPTYRVTQQGRKHEIVYMKFVRQADRTNEALMGWTATTDPTGNLTISFPNSEAAVAFAQRNGLEYELHIHEHQDVPRDPRDYAFRFRHKPLDTGEVDL